MSVVVVAERVVRFSSLVFALLAAGLLGFNRETEILLVEKTATVKDIRSFWVLTIASSVAGCYHMIQLIKGFIVRSYAKERSEEGEKLDGFVSLALDQSTMYVVVATTAAAIQGGLIALFGQEEFQWMKLSDMFKKFCKEDAGGLVCAVASSCSMALLNVVCSHQLFKLYISPYSPSKLSTKV